METIILVRHGRSTHVHTSTLIDIDGVARWREAYDAAGIVNDPPPPALVTVAGAAERIVSSDMRRALESAERLAPGRARIVTPLLREAPHEVPRIPIRLPLHVWEAAIWTRWAWQRLRGKPALPQDLKRAEAAARWLTDLADAGSTTVVVTHGVFRALLARELNALGWRGPGESRKYHNWSAWTLSRVGRL